MRFHRIITWIYFQEPAFSKILLRYIFATYEIHQTLIGSRCLIIGDLLSMRQGNSVYTQ